MMRASVVCGEADGVAGLGGGAGIGVVCTIYGPLEIIGDAVPVVVA